MKKVLGILAVAGLLIAASPALAAHSDHGCFNCHVPHNAGLEGDENASWGVPLWSTAQLEDAAIPTYTLYSSPLFDSLGTDIGQPDGASKLCLGCHDGTYSHMHTESRIFDNAAEDLVRSHPISFTYDTALATAHPNGTLRDPATADAGLGNGQTIQAALLDGKGKMQCTSCHDVHTSGLGENLLRWEWGYPTNENVMCRVCHDK